MQAYDLDQGYGGAAKLGLIVLSTDETLENEARQVLAGRAVSLVHARIKAEADVTPDALKMMEKRLPEVARLLPEGLKAVGYACTSASTVIGPQRVAELVRQSHPEAAVSDPITAVMAGLGALKAKRIGFVSPYVKEVTAPMRRLLAQNGFEAVSEVSFEQSEDRKVARISERSTLEAIETAAKMAECDAVFASCTNLRSFGILDEAERRAGCPVISSNQALLWHLLKLAGLSCEGGGPGKLNTL
ncbi:aspartate/glutamate racemase family protein [uncultured Lentibacter sp.]|uniref:maleate cis-trans isomerase family protein n=1 Tax=uncultured Lentibacter sp. TaxID=1659309 RepID=UPI002635E4DF|nr:aspartate/glutamate racemase family protein [uncultured Lentibacter sp.]MCW1956370.1 aspartate/glutamate racemase family protein [Roseobacter sp.]